MPVMSSLPPSSALLGIDATGSIATLKLKRPERRNALTRELVLELGAVIQTLGQHEELRAIILTGQGGAFCSGADLTTITESKPQELPARIEEFHVLIRGVVEARQPVIAAIDGPAVGFGADLALSCDFRVMTESAYLQESFIHIGLMPDGGGTYWAQRYLGARAFEVLALGERIDAKQCERLGLANVVTRQGEAENTAQALAGRLARTAPLSLARIKAALRAQMRSELDAALDREKKGQAELLQSQDFQEGIQAFLEKRAPHFLGK